MFRFKQFTVLQQRASFKVGTDGCLLGAWAPVKNASNILDIGTGTGVIALMLAQRNPVAEITGIEPDEGSFADASENFAQSPWADRMACFHMRLQDFASKESGRFDTITCNPPFFVGSTPNADARKHATRHEATLDLPTLFRCVRSLLSPEGTFSLVLPMERRDDCIQAALNEKLYPAHSLFLKPLPEKPAHRFLTTFGRNECVERVDHANIKEAEPDYSEPIHQLLKDFYLYL